MPDRDDTCGDGTAIAAAAEDTERVYATLVREHSAPLFRLPEPADEPRRSSVNTEREPTDDLQALWKNQSLEGKTEMSIEQVRAKSLNFERTIRQRDAVEHIAVGIVVLLFGARALAPGASVYERVSALLIVAAALYVAVRLHRGSGNPETAPVGEATATYVGFYRVQLARPRDLLARAWLWYVAPFVPGLALSVIGHALDASSRGKSMWFIAVEALILTVVLGAVALVNRAAARKLQRQIDALSA